MLRQSLIRRAQLRRAVGAIAFWGAFAVFVFCMMGMNIFSADAAEISEAQNSEPCAIVQNAGGMALETPDSGGESPKPGQAHEAKTMPEAKAASDKKTAPVRLFGTVEFRSIIRDLPKWERVRNSENTRPSFTGSGMDTKDAQTRERWKKLKQAIADASLQDKIQKVNNFFNQWPYRADREIWGVEDYWATPREFVEHAGDCEDYAIAKYYALRDLGVPASHLRVIALKDAIRNLGHAVLVIYMEDGARILDNLTNLILPHEKLKHYMPQYSVNEEYLWRHVKPKSVPAKK